MLTFFVPTCLSLSVRLTAVPRPVAPVAVLASRGTAVMLAPVAPVVQGYHLLVLVTQGLEDVASEYLTANNLVAGPVQVLSQPPVALGEAAVGKLLVQVAAPDPEVLLRLQCAPVVQAVLAFVAAADGLATSGSWNEDGGVGAAAVPNGMLAEMADLVGTSPHWEHAIDLLAASGVRDVKSFRASCACSGRKLEGFGSDDAMRAMGGGVVTGGASPEWSVDLYGYEVELQGLLCDGHYACGLLLGGEWRTTESVRRRKFSIAPFCEAAGRPYLEHSSSPWYMPRLRPSTALLLLLLAKVRPGEVLLDPFGGSGTVAIEAAVHLSNVTAITADNHRPTASAAIRNLKLARKCGLATGAELRAQDWDATDLRSRLNASSVDCVVADLPFGHRCRWDVALELPLFLDELSHVLRPGGRAVLLMPGYRRVADILGGADIPAGAADISAGPGAGGEAGLVLVARRRVNVGGFGCWALTLEATRG